MFRLEEIADELREIAQRVEPREYAGSDAVRLTEAAAGAERVCNALKMLFGRRAVESGAWRTASHAATPDQWFANVSGSTEAAARDALATAERLDELPATEARLRDGSLSLGQASLVTQGASIDPSAESVLLRLARKGEMRTLRAEKERVVAAATDETEGRTRAHRARHLRTWTRGFATDGGFSGPTDDVAVLLRALEPLQKQAFDAARTAGTFESHDAYRFDALIALARGALGSSGEGTDAELAIGRVRVDLRSLLDGKTEPGQVCEIPGVGPVPVAHARKVLSHGLLELVITDGIDVQTVVSTTRHVPKALKIAIEERDRACKVEGCDRTDHLERHHVAEYAANRLTTYEILGRLCQLHHDLVTHRGYTVERNPDGSWTLRPPDERRDTDAA